MARLSLRLGRAFRKEVMGSWDATCALSGLNIGYKDPVYLLLLAKSVGHSAFRHSGWGVCYTQMDWAPLLVPIRGTYDTYGGIEKVKTGPHTEALLKYFVNPAHYRIVNRACDKGDERDNPPFDTVEKIVRCAGRGYLQIKQYTHHSELTFDANGDYDYSASSKGYFNDWVDVGYMLIHAHIFDSMVGPIKFMVEGSRLDESIKKSLLLQEEFHPYKTEAARNEFMLYKLEERAFSDCSFKWDRLGYSPDYRDPLLALVPKLDMVMMDLRKFYSPQAGASQENNNKEITRLHRLTQSVIKRRNKSYEE